jgi:hemerythrin-like domain-containing protein
MSSGDQDERSAPPAALREALEHHIQEEEQEIFPKAREAWDQSKLEQAGREMELAEGGRAVPLA